MLQPRRLLLLLLLSTLPMQWTRADALVLVHGYLGDAQSWVKTGVTRVLGKSGWQFGGYLTAGPQGVSVRGGNRAPANSADANAEAKLDKRFYLLSLPSEAPIDYQMRLLEPMLQQVRQRHPDERLALVGHSLGGVLSRYAMVRHPELKVDTLLTIASPHLGTDKAELALLAGSTPLSMMAPFVGGDTINRSRQLYTELVPAKPGTFLYWLNNQEHPEARYFSVLRGGSEGLSMGDMIVPEYSQDMNNVAALRGRSHSRRSPSEHSLGPADGTSIVLALEYPR